MLEVVLWMQIPMVIGYHEMFEDVATFHIWGTVAMNQAFNYKKNVSESNVHSLRQTICHSIKV